MGKTFHAKILGQKLPLKSDLSEENLQEISTYVEDVAQRVKDRFNTVDSLRIAIITAINIAEEFWNYRKKKEETYFLIEKRIDALQGKIASALNETLPGS